MGGKLCRVRQVPFVEPISFVYSLWISLMFVIISQYMYYRISEEVGFPYLNLTTTGNGCNEEHFGANSTMKKLEIQVQTESANLLAFYLIFATLSTVIMSPFMGSYSDQKGRKIVFVASLTGALLETTLLLVVVHLKLNVYVVIAGGIINGLTGSSITLWLGLMSYLSDTVEKDKLALRMAIIQLSFYLAGIVSQLTSGLWIENLGFKPPMWFLWGSLLLILLYTMFFLRENMHPKKDVKVAFFSMDSLKRNMRVVTKRRPGGRRRNLIFLIVFFAISCFAMYGTFAVQLLYLLRSPLCWIPTILGYWLAYHSLVVGLGCIAGIGILKKHCSEMNITRIGFVSQIAGSLLMAFSDKTWMVFLVPVARILSEVIYPVLLSISSRLVSSEEQGVLFAVIGIIAAAGRLIGTSLFNALYPLSLRFNFPGFVFVLSAGIIIVQIFMTRRWIGIPQDVLNQKEEQEEKYDENKTENQLEAEKLTECQDQEEDVCSTKL